MPVSAARSVWLAAEPLHAVVYFAPEVRAAMRAAGLRGFWMGYFAGRAAPMGPVPASVVTATFFNFHPAMVERAIPDAWGYASPAATLAARLGALQSVLERTLSGSDAVPAAALAGAAAAIGDALDGVPIAGRPLFAAHRALPRPEHPLLALWHACTLLREHRGDGHVATLLTEGVSGIEAHVIQAAAGTTTPETQRENRGWSIEEWDAAVERLRSRGWFDSEGRLTPDGTAVRARVEARTDELAAAPLDALGPHRDAVVETLERCRAQVLAAEMLPFPNPIALPRPW